MNERQQLEADLDKAKENLANAVADFDTATLVFAQPDGGLRSKNSNLCTSFTALADSEIDLDKARARVAKARADCLRASAALAEYYRAPVSEPLIQSSDQVTRNVGKHQANISHGRKLAGSFAVPHQKDVLVPSDPSVRTRLTKESVMLLALVLAYLQYYFVDAQLQIAKLPATAIVLLG